MIILNFKIGNIVSYIGESGIDLSRAEGTCPAEKYHERYG